MILTFIHEVTYPLDITKTRLQIQGELEKHNPNRKHYGMFRTALNIGKLKFFIKDYTKAKKVSSNSLLVMNLFYSNLSNTWR